jgi:hypothetical protein
VFRAGNRGEFLNQKILCAFIGPPLQPGQCPTGDPLVPEVAATSTAAPTSGESAIESLLTKAVDG